MKTTSVKRRRPKASQARTLEDMLLANEARGELAVPARGAARRRMQPAIR